MPRYKEEHSKLSHMLARERKNVDGSQKAMRLM